MKRFGTRRLLVAGVLLVGASATVWAQLGKKEELRVVKSADLKWESINPPAAVKRAILEGDLAKPGPLTWRTHFPDGFKYPPHTHVLDEHITVLQGTFYVGVGTKFDQAVGKELPAGSYAVIPAGVPHFAWAKGDTIVQGHGTGPWGVSFVNPEDDPRRGKPANRPGK